MWLYGTEIYSSGVKIEVEQFWRGWKLGNRHSHLECLYSPEERRFAPASRIFLLHPSPPPLRFTVYHHFEDIYIFISHFDRVCIKWRFTRVVRMPILNLYPFPLMSYIHNIQYTANVQAKQTTSISHNNSLQNQVSPRKHSLWTIIVTWLVNTFTPCPRDRGVTSLMTACIFLDWSHYVTSSVMTSLLLVNAAVYYLDILWYQIIYLSTTSSSLL